MFKISKHNKWDKFFFMSNSHIHMEIDYDDVNHAEVDAATDVVLEILNKHWDEKLYKEKYKEKILEMWEINEYNLQNDFENKEEYLENYGITT